MSKIFDALENARVPIRETARVSAGTHGSRIDLAAAAPVLATAPVLPRFSGVKMEDEMLRLHQRLDGLFAGHGPRVIQFIGSRKGEGTSAVVREFARVSATRFGQRVLLLEMGNGEGDNAGPERPLAAIAPSRIGGSSLYVAPLPLEIAEACIASGSPRSTAYAAWERLREAYDLVLVDSPPVTTSPLGLAVSSQVDGVVLVVEAEHTRWPVADSVKESIERSGGRVLGIVFNKRRHYIPAFIYKRL